MPDPSTYTVGWICAVEKELVAAKAFLDEEHDQPDHITLNDNNAYVLGRIGKHNVVIAPMPHWKNGSVSSATVARDMIHSFPSVRIGLMVGIGGGAPNQRHDIRLGDIVASSPSYGSGGVLQYDFGRTVQNQTFTNTGYLNQPPQCILTAITLIKSKYESDGHTIEEAIERIFQKKPRLRAKYRRPNTEADRLYKSSYVHGGSEDDSCEVICDVSNAIARRERTQDDDIPTVHYGLIASADNLLKVVELISPHEIKAKLEMVKFLNDMPPPSDLSKIYARLFAKNTGRIAANGHIAAAALEVLSVSRRPLSILEIGWAVAFMTNRNCSRDIQQLADTVDSERTMCLIRSFVAGSTSAI
jgi:nucleoside phosphorylase